MKVICLDFDLKLTIKYKTYQPDFFPINLIYPLIIPVVQIFGCCLQGWQYCFVLFFPFPTGLSSVCSDLPRGAKCTSRCDPDRVSPSPRCLDHSSSGAWQQLCRRGQCSEPEARQSQISERYSEKRKNVWVVFRRKE